METTSQLDKLIAALTKLREASPFKGQTVPCICFQGMEYVPVSSAKLDIDSDGATLLLIPEEPNAVQTALDGPADQTQASNLARSVLRQAWAVYDALRREAGVSAPNEILWHAGGPKKIYQAIADGVGGARAVVTSAGNPCDCLVYHDEHFETEVAACDAIHKLAVAAGLIEDELADLP